MEFREALSRIGQQNGAGNCPQKRILQDHSTHRKEENDLEDQGRSAKAQQDQKHHRSGKKFLPEDEEHNKKVQMERF